MRDHKTSLATLSIRSIVLVTKFIFIFYLAKITSPENIGAFGLLQASSIIFTFIAGFQMALIFQEELQAEKQYSRLNITTLGPLF